MSEPWRVAKNYALATEEHMFVVHSNPGCCEARKRHSHIKPATDISYGYPYALRSRKGWGHGREYAVGDAIVGGNLVAILPDSQAATTIIRLNG